MPIRTIVVTRQEAGKAVVALLKSHLHLSWGQARHLVENNRVRQGPRLCRNPQSRAREGQKLRVNVEDDKASGGVYPRRPENHPRRPENHPRRVDENPHRHAKPKPSGPQPTLLYVDDHIVVVNKPPGLTTMRHAHEAAEFGQRGKRFLPATLAELLPQVLAVQGKGQGRVIAVHRLDRDTSGLVIFARNPKTAKHLNEQFRRHATERTYQAIVRGRPKAGRIESYLVPDRGDGRRGSLASRRASALGSRGSPAPSSQRAVTHVRVIEELGDFALVECRLETGRTHQVRIHLGERGTPICGEHVYDRPAHGAPLPDASGARRLALHAATLAVEHPVSGKKMRWMASLPADMQQLLKNLRRSL